MKITYIGITKVASTSIRHWIAGRVPYRVVGSYPLNLRGFPVPGSEPENPLVTLLHCHDESPESNMARYEALGKEWKEFEFTCVRNPLDRLVSGYFHQKGRTEKNGVPRRTVTGKFNFKTFVMKREKVAAMMDTIEFNHTFRLQTSFPIHNCKVIMKIENIKSDWERLCDMAGLKYAPLLQENDTTHDDFLQYYDAEMLEALRSYLKPDFDFLRYEYP
jgi:hypothetical protein